MPKRATGTFEVVVKPVTDTETTVASGRMSIEKKFEGDLRGSARGEMWTVGTPVQGSAGYVAIDRVTGTLEGREGTFVLLHQATMRKGGEFNMSLVVVPDSGTDGLEGIAGKLTIVIEGGKHSYELEYTLG